MLVSKFGGSHKTGFFLLDDFPTFFHSYQSLSTESFSSLHYFLASSEKSILYSFCTLQNKGKAVKLQETAVTKEPYDPQPSLKPIYSPKDDLFKRIHPTTGVESSYQGPNFLKFLIHTKIMMPLGVFT